MNIRIILRTIGRILILESLLMLLPLAVALYYREASVMAFAMAIVITAIAGIGMSFIPLDQGDRTFYAREGFTIVALSWVGMGIFGALPFWLSRQIPSYIDALFETISGFTTTGASVLQAVEGLDYGMLFWRSFTHWIGGMGVLVFIMTVIKMGENSMYLIRAEMPGPVVEKITPKASDTAKLLYAIYLAMTLIEIALLCAGGMSLFDSAVHSFGTAGTGGFSVKNASIAAYPSPYIQWVIAIFMVLFGVNFNIYYLLLRGNWRRIFHSEELRWYLAIVGASVVLIAVNIHSMYTSVGETVRHSAFQVASIITTTGYATTDFNLWPQFSRMILLLLMVCGACAGSTGGGIKVSRVVILIKSAARSLHHVLHPRSVRLLRFEDRTLDEARVKEVGSFFVLYSLIGAGTVLLLSIDGMDFETNFSAMLACLNNIGPGLGIVGPVGNYAGFSNFGKLLLSLNMLLGRLEIYPILLLMLPIGWRKNPRRYIKRRG